MDFKTDVMPTLLRENLAVFSYKFGTKKVNITTLQRRKKSLNLAKKLQNMPITTC